MTRQLFLFFLLVIVIMSASGQEAALVKIRVAKGHVGFNKRYQDRVYHNQVEYDLIRKTIFRRKNEARSFRSASLAFPEILDSLTASDILALTNKYSSLHCNAPDKNFFYKIDLIYCERYPTHIRSFEVKYNPFGTKRPDEDIFQLLIRHYWETAW